MDEDARELQQTILEILKLAYKIGSLNYSTLCEICNRHGWAVTEKSIVETNFKLIKRI